MIFSSNEWAQAALSAPPIPILPGLQGDNWGPNQMAVARRAAGNAAFFGAPLRLEEILHAHLDEEAEQLTPRPFLTEAQRTRFDNILNGFIADVAGASILFAANNQPVLSTWEAPHMMHGGVGISPIGPGNVLIGFGFSNLASAQNFVQAQGHVFRYIWSWAGGGGFLVDGLETVVSNGFVFYVGSAFRGALDTVLQRYP